MTANVGTVDRIVRIAAGAALIGVALGLFGPAYQTAWGWIGVLPLLTGLPTRSLGLRPADLRRQSSGPRRDLCHRERPQKTGLSALRMR
jgi:hypothetical protein